jgi:hypothetical protein
MMNDLSSSRLMYLKAALFLGIGSMSAALLILDAPAMRTVLLIAVMVWAFSRAYYFCFYIVERYIDPSFRFSGLFSVAIHFLNRRRQKN